MGEGARRALDATVEEYDALTCVWVFHSVGLEVEYGFASVDWAALPLEEGTREAVSHGMRVIFEREPLLTPLLAQD